MIPPASPSTAEEFFALMEASDPDRYAEVCARYPVQTEYRELRDRERLGRKPTKWAYPSGGVPRDAKRRLTAEELQQLRSDKREYLKEWALDYAFAKELAESGY